MKKNYSVKSLLSLSILLLLLSLPVGDLYGKHSKHAPKAKAKAALKHKPVKAKAQKILIKKPLAPKPDLSNRPIDERLNALLNGKALDKTKFSAAVYSLDKSAYLYKKNIDSPLTPASVTKLVTTYTALKNFGFDYKIRTSIYTDAKEIKETLEGNVYIVGRGDVFLSISDLERVADELSAMGIKKINGNVYADGSFFDGKSDRKAYSGDKDMVEAIPPITTFCMQKNTITVVVTSGARPGDAVRVHAIPASEEFKFNITARVGSAKATPAKQPKKSAKAKPAKRRGDALITTIANAKSGLRVTNSSDPEGKQLITISGSMPPNRTTSYKFTIMKPDLATAGVLKSRLEAGGIEIKGKIGRAVLPAPKDKAQPILLAELRRPLIDVISICLKESDNYLAETVFKIMGGEAGGKENTAAKSRELEFNMLKGLGADINKIMLNDGSGLSRRNKLTAEAIVKVLADVSKSKNFAQYSSSLSIAGVDGTLRKRMHGTKAEENVHAKTGTHANVSALAGYLKTASGENLVFAFLFNGNNVNSYKKIENDLCILLSEYNSK